MNIMPMHEYTRKDRPWVIRWLRYCGYLLVVLSIFFGVAMIGPGLTDVLVTSFSMDYNGASVLSLVVGAFGGFFGGLIVTVPYWGLALLLDDIHAIRVQTSGYAALGDKNGGV